MTPTIPHGMRQVSKEEFWRMVMNTRQNIHPTNERLHTEWYVVGTRQLWGWTSRGYASPYEPEGKETTVYAVAGGAA